jgi:TPR repeat protein
MIKRRVDPVPGPLRPTSDEQMLFFGCGENMYCPEEVCVSYWLIAAMLDLRMDFRYGSRQGDLSIESYQGAWKYRINDGTQIRSKYWDIEDDTHQIDFFLNDASDDGLYSESYWQLKKEVGAYCPNADLGHADAQKHIADIYYFGTYHINRDLIRAYVWYTLSASGGDKEAEKLLSQVILELTPDQINEAQSLFKEWVPGLCERDLMKAIPEENE